jgi:hypothetical protein
MTYVTLWDDARHEDCLNSLDRPSRTQIIALCDQIMEILAGKHLRQQKGTRRLDKVVKEISRAIRR